MLKSFASHTCTIILLHDINENSDSLYKSADINHKRSLFGNCKFIIPDAKIINIPEIKSNQIYSWNTFL